MFVYPKFPFHVSSGNIPPMLFMSASVRSVLTPGTQKYKSIFLKFSSVTV